jgi:parallel beta-helix repeat protein
MRYLTRAGGWCTTAVVVGMLLGACSDVGPAGEPPAPGASEESPTALASEESPTALASEVPTDASPADGQAEDREASGAGAAAVGTATHDVPDGAVFVSPSGDDTASGTSEAPLRTLERAIKVADSGDTIVLRGGTYHEKVTVPANKKLVIQSYPGEAVWLDGSTPVRDWRDSGDVWVADGWTAEFEAPQSFSGTVSNAPGWSFVNEDHPMAAHPDQVFVDGAALRQVGSREQVEAGAFFVDEAADRLYVGSDPRGRDVRASDLTEAITVQSQSSTLRGIGVRRYATPLTKIAAVKAAAPGISFENLVITDNAASGVSATAVDVTMRNITVRRSGLLGLHAHYADGLTVQAVRSETNNTEGFNQSPSAGGFKFTRSRGVVVRDSVFAGNQGPGLWADESAYDITVVGNDVVNNSGHGMSLELSAKAVVADNLVLGNGKDGVKINNTAHVAVWNNTFKGNKRTIWVAQDDRLASNLDEPGHDPRQPLPDPTMTWVITDVIISNNIFSHANSQTNCVVCVEDYTGSRSAEQMGVTFNGNVYNRSSSTTPKWVVVWADGAADPKVFTTVAAFTSETGQERRSIAQDGAPLVADDGVAADAVTEQAETVAQPLPADVAAPVGEETGARQLGAWTE